MIKKMIPIATLLMLLPLASCANLSGTREYDEYNQHNYIKNFPAEIDRQKRLENIRLIPVKNFSRIVYTSTQGEVDSHHSISVGNGIFIERINHDSDDIRMIITIRRYPDKMIESFELDEIYYKSTNQDLSPDEVEELKGLLVNSGILNGYDQAGDYALNKSLSPGYISRCLAYEAMAENTLKFMYEQAGGRAGQASVISRSQCEYLGSATLNGREVAVFSEWFLSSLDAPEIQRKTEFSASGWRAVDINTGQDYRIKVKGNFLFNGKRLVGKRGFEGWTKTYF